MTAIKRRYYKIVLGFYRLMAIFGKFPTSKQYAKTLIQYVRSWD